MKRQWYDIQNKDDVAEIFIYDVIGEDWYGGVSAKQFIDDLGKVSAKNITLRINSPGGDVFDGAAIYNAIQSHEANIHVSIEGLAASMASVVAMAGDTVSMAENALMMIHDPWTMAVGDAGELRKTADTLDKVRSTLLNAYVKKADIESDKISDMMTEETWMDANEALEMGFIDSISDQVKMAAHYDKSYLNQYQHTPEIDDIEKPKNNLTYKIDDHNNFVFMNRI